MAGKALGWALLALVALPTAGVLAQDTAIPAPSPLVAAQQEALTPFAGLAGEWRGEGWALTGDERVPVEMTIRAGPALDQTTMFIDMRSYRQDGSVQFQAFNNIAFDTDHSAYVMQARAEGRFGDFALQATGSGYVWNIGSEDAGLRYTGSISDGTWTEVTEVLTPGQPPQRIASFTVRRVRTTAWPEDGALEAE